MVLRESSMPHPRPASSAAIVGPSSVPLEPNRRRRTFSRPDAFESVTLPPANESEHDRSARVLKEREAKAVSDGIDAQLHRDKNNQKKRREVKVLLLGQSESGKSTTLKQFQLLHTPEAFQMERIAWRLVIYLNLVRSVKRILDAIAPDETRPPLDDPISEEELLTATPSYHGPSILNITAEGVPPSALRDNISTRVQHYDTHRRALIPVLALEDILVRALASPDSMESTDEVVPMPHVAAAHANGYGYGAGMGMASPVAVASTSSIQVPPSPSDPAFGGAKSPTGTSWGWSRHREDGGTGTMMSGGGGSSTMLNTYSPASAYGGVGTAGVGMWTSSPAVSSPTSPGGGRSHPFAFPPPPGYGHHGHDNGAGNLNTNINTGAEWLGPPSPAPTTSAGGVPRSPSSASGSSGRLTHYPSTASLTPTAASSAPATLGPGIVAPAGPPPPYGFPTTASPPPLVAPSLAPTKSRTGEPVVSQRSKWKAAFSLGGRLRAQSPKDQHTGEIEGWWEDPDDPVHVLHACAGAIERLWRDESVRARLRERRVRLEESSGFFLNDIERVTGIRYFPTDADVLRARLKTTGVVEHTFTLRGSATSNMMDWKIYDVGGERSQRQAWAPYFDDVNAIIFLAPISAFDQVLAEDPSVNRLEDTLLLWKQLVSNKLLRGVNIVLFLNKCDLLQRKLAAGVRLAQYMTSYKDRPNDFESVAGYFRNKFGAMHQLYTPNKERELHIHMTAVTDMRRTSVLIHQVRDIILRTNLKESHFV